MSEAPDLLPCPFCEGEAWLNDYEAKHSGMPARSRCPQCKSCGCSLGYHPTESKAIAAWNRRADLVPAPGWQPIATAPVGIPVLAYCYGGEVLMTRITKHGEDEYARNPDLWMQLPKPPTKDSTHD